MQKGYFLSKPCCSIRHIRVTTWNRAIYACTSSRREWLTDVKKVQFDKVLEKVINQYIYIYVFIYIYIYIFVIKHFVIIYVIFYVLESYISIKRYRLDISLHNLPDHTNVCTSQFNLILRWNSKHSIFSSLLYPFNYFDLIQNF